MTEKCVAVTGRAVRVVLILLIAAAACPSAIFADDPPEILWNKTIPGVPAVQGRDVAIGPDQNPVAVGQILGPGPATTVVVVKYKRATGSEIWRSSSLRVPFGAVGGVAIGSDGTIFVGGHGGGPPFGPRYFVAKYRSGGRFVSSTFINPGLPARSDTIGGIAVGPDGNPVLTGITQSLGTFKLLTVKVSGLTLGVRAQAQAPFANVPFEQKEAGVAVASSNEIFVTGTRAGTIKYDADLSATPLWTRPVQGRKIAVRSGNVNESDSERLDSSERQEGDREGEDEVAVIRTAGAPGKGDFEIQKLDGETGVSLWGLPKIYDSGFDDIPRGVAFDRDGNILVTGERNGSPSFQCPTCPKFNDGQTVSLDPEGMVQWVAVFNTGTVSGVDVKDTFFAVAVGRDSNPVVTGSSGPVMRTIKYSADQQRQEGVREDQR